MRRKIDIKIGENYGYLTVISEAGATEHGDRLFQCQCRCGNFCTKKATILRYTQARGYQCSCGCRGRKKNNG